MLERLPVAGYRHVLPDQVSEYVRRLEAVGAAVTVVPAVESTAVRGPVAVDPLQKHALVRGARVVVGDVQPLGTPAHGGRARAVASAADGVVRMSLEEVARTAYFRTHEVPKDFQPELTVTRSYAQKSYPGAVTNGIQASLLEVDPDTGFVKLIRHWVVDDCGTEEGSWITREDSADEKEFRRRLVGRLAAAPLPDPTVKVKKGEEQPLIIDRNAEIT